jgi:hypothetical protein
MYEFLAVILGTLNLTIIALFLISMINPKVGLFWFKKERNRKVATGIYFLMLLVLTQVGACVHNHTTFGKAEIAEKQKRIAESEAEEQKRLAESKAEEQKELLAKMEETKKYGLKPSTSGWNGVAESVDYCLQHTLNDPDSLKYGNVSGLAKTVYNNKDCYVQAIDYRAKNGFGGYVRKSALFYIKNEVVIGYEEL